MNNNNEEKQMTREQKVYETFVKRHIANLEWLEAQNVSWSKGVGLASYHLVEFGCYHSNGDLTQCASILLHAIAASGFKRHEMGEYIEANEIAINIETALSLEDHCQKATLLAIVAILEIFEDFKMCRLKSKNNLH